MAQVFSPSANTLARASLFSAFILPGLLLVVGSGITRGPSNTKVEEPLDQPIPFSHEHHATELGIDCRYCHSEVEKSSAATIPPTHTCMSCHSQIWTNSPLLEPIRESYRTGQPIKFVTGEVGWNQVNKVPEFVYFNHSIHINRGINCNICHGPMEKEQLTYKGQPLFMAWCLRCHRNPEYFIRPREEEFNLYQKYQRGEIALTTHTLTSKEGLTPEEVNLLNGNEYQRTPEEVEEGKRLVEQYHVNVKQLADCWICHR